MDKEKQNELGHAVAQTFNKCWHKYYRDTFCDEYYVSEDDETRPEDTAEAAFNDGYFTCLGVVLAVLKQQQESK